MTGTSRPAVSSLNGEKGVCECMFAWMNAGILNHVVTVNKTVSTKAQKYQMVQNVSMTQN